MVVEGRDRALTERQRRVLGLVAQGFGSKEIAATLGISVNGVKKHVDCLRRRYGVSSRLTLVMAALAAGDVGLQSSPEEPAAAVGTTADVRAEVLRSLSH